MYERIEEDDELFFDRLQDMQLEEQVEVLKLRIAHCVENLAYGTPHQKIVVQSTLTKLNGELRRVNGVIHRGQWATAVRTVFGYEGYTAVKLEIERMQGFPYMKKEQ